MSIHTLHTPLERGSNCVGHPTTSIWIATCTHLGPRTLYPCHKHHNMQTLSAVSCQPSAVSCRSFFTTVHAFGTSRAFLSHHYLHAFSTTDTTTTTTTTITNPITMYQTHAPLHIFHHYLSDTRYLSDFPPQIKRRTLFIRSPTTIYQTHAPFHALHSHHYLHAFIARPPTHRYLHAFL